MSEYHHCTFLIPMLHTSQIRGFQLLLLYIGMIETVASRLATQSALSKGCWKFHFSVTEELLDHVPAVLSTFQGNMWK
jgi:hypothetical protein